MKDYTNGSFDDNGIVDYESIEARWNGYGGYDYYGDEIPSPQPPVIKTAPSVTKTNPPGAIVVVSTPPEKVYTEEEFRALKIKYSNPRILKSHLKTESISDFIDYVRALHKRFTSATKEFESCNDKIDRTARYATYSLKINNEFLVYLSWERYDSTTLASIYSAKRVSIMKGDYIVGHNNNTEKDFILTVDEEGLEGLTNTNVGVFSEVQGIYDIEISVKYNADRIKLKAPSEKDSELDEAIKSRKVALKLMTQYRVIAKNLFARLNNYMNNGGLIKEDLLPEFLVSWQRIAYMSDYEIYSAYDKKVRIYGTSY